MQHVISAFDLLNRYVFVQLKLKLTLVPDCGFGLV